MPPLTAARRAFISPVWFLAVLALGRENFTLCVLVDRSDYQQAAAALLASEYFNERNPELPKVNLLLYDQGNVPMDAFDRAQDCVNNGGIGIVGPSYSSRSTVISQFFLRNQYVPACSFSATAPTLSDNESYPFFTRTIPPDDKIVFAIPALAERIGWSNKIAVLHTNDAFGQGVYDALRELKTSGHFPDNLDLVGGLYSAQDITDGEGAMLDLALQDIFVSGARAIVWAGTTNTLVEVLQRANRTGLVGPKHTWIGLDSFTFQEAHADLMSGSLQVMASGCPGGPSKSSVVERLTLSDGSGHPSPKVTELGDAYASSAFGRMVAEEYRVDLAAVTYLDCLVGFAYDGVLLMATAYGQIAHMPRTVNETECTTTDPILGSNLYNALLRTNLTNGATGNVSLLGNGDRDPSTVAVSVFNHRPNGTYFVGDLLENAAGVVGFNMRFSDILWSDGTNTPPVGDGCDPGFEHAAGSMECTQCSAGECRCCMQFNVHLLRSFQHARAARCTHTSTLFATGKFANLDTPSCQLCPESQYSQSIGSSSCEMCMKIQSIADQCQTCRAGKYRVDKECYDCARDTFTGSENMEACMACPQGTFQKEAGMAYCEEVEEALRASPPPPSRMHPPSAHRTHNAS
jgi:ABC-type branched-subunit amino acid transport system substrate-binding protein